MVLKKNHFEFLNQRFQEDHIKHRWARSLCHRYITTDFSEAQLELITPPLIDKKKGLIFLDNIHHFVSHNIEDEIIWPLSMPPWIQSDEDIPIASYGSSNLALFKTGLQKWTLT